MYFIASLVQTTLCTTITAIKQNWTRTGNIFVTLVLTMLSGIYIWFLQMQNANCKMKTTYIYLFKFTNNILSKLVVRVFDIWHVSKRHIFLNYFCKILSTFVHVLHWFLFLNLIRWLSLILLRTRSLAFVYNIWRSNNTLCPLPYRCNCNELTQRCVTANTFYSELASIAKYRPHLVIFTTAMITKSVNEKSNFILSHIAQSRNTNYTNFLAC